MTANRAGTPLKSEAEGIVRKLSLLELLRRYGEARVVGSVALDLVVKKDIDIHVLTGEHDLFRVVDSVYRQAVTAAGLGCKAAIDAERWLADKGIE